MSDPADTTLIRCDSDPSPLEAPVVERFEHWGYEWAVTHMEQSKNGKVEFSNSVIVTNVKTGAAVPFTFGDTADEAKTKFYHHIEEKSPEWVEQKIEELGPVRNDEQDPSGDDFPRCESCDYWHRPEIRNHDDEHRALCERGTGSGGQATHTTADFGCILHSSLESQGE